jgi:hypothetical protein
MAIMTEIQLILLLIIAATLMVFLTKDIWAAWIVDGVTYKDAFVTPAQRAENINSIGNMIAYPLLIFAAASGLFLAKILLTMLLGRKWHRAF